eukprot:2954445-Amphidinium_carterae.1
MAKVWVSGFAPFQVVCDRVAVYGSSEAEAPLSGLVFQQGHPGLVVCRECARYASKRWAMLSEPCSGSAGKSRAVLRRLRRGCGRVRLSHPT